jgi:hypothetical protein
MPLCGSFLIDGDDRLLHSHIITDISSGSNTTFSFDPSNLSNGCCGNTKVVKGEVWVLCDQNFPPILPCYGRGGCLKIIRIEEGDLSTLASTWLTKFGNKVGNGITMLIASASQLAREGLAGYVDSFLETSNRLKMGGEGLQSLTGPLYHVGWV